MIGLSLIVIAFVFGVVGGVVGFFITIKQHHYLTYADVLKIDDGHWDTLKQYIDIRCDFSKYDKWIESIHNSAAHSLDCIVEERQRDRELENYITLVDDRVKAHVRWSLGIWNDVARRCDILTAGDIKMPSAMEKLADEYAEELKKDITDDWVSPMGPQEKEVIKISDLDNADEVIEQLKTLTPDAEKFRDIELPVHPITEDDIVEIFQPEEEVKDNGDTQG